MDQILEAHIHQARQWRVFEADFVPGIGNIEESDWVAGTSGDGTITASEAGSN